MNWINTMLLLVVAYVIVFLEATVNSVRDWTAVQFDLLPSLMVYVGLTRGLPMVTVMAVCGGLWFDSLSANPLGVSVLPLFVAGWCVQRYKGLILRDQVLVQRLLGLAASAGVPLLTLLILLNTDRKPMLGLVTVWQIFFISVTGALATPLWFKVFDKLSNAVSYKTIEQSSFRLDREIKRGRG